jgi:uncharacterized membrane protein (DUF441 family)
MQGIMRKYNKERRKKVIVTFLKALGIGLGLIIIWLTILIPIVWN